MSSQLRIGWCMEPGDVFWVQVRETFYHRSKQMSVEIVPINSAGFPLDPSRDQQHSVLEEIISQELDVLVGWNFQEHMAYPLLDMGLPIVHLSESDIEHPLSVSPLGLQMVAQDLAHFLARKLNCEGHVVAIGGLMQSGFPDDGRTRLVGIQEAFQEYSRLRLTHIPTKWMDDASERVSAALEQSQSPIDAIYGLSDSLALLGKEIALKLGRCKPDIPVVGINGDPMALAAIIQGNMTATVETSAADLANQALDITLDIAQGKAYPNHFPYKSRFITAENVAQAAAEKLVVIATIPEHLVGVKQQEQDEYLSYLETSLNISRQIGSILDDHALPAELAKLISTNYGYDHVQLFYWSERQQVLTLVNAASPVQKVYVPLLQSGVLGEALTRDELIFIPDTQRSFRFAPDPDWPNTRSRVILPIRVGNQLLGLLDLHAYRIVHCTRQHLLGLQSLTDQIGIAIQNSKLYQEAVQARASAEKAEQLKTRFMTNISHDLRNPLHIVLGYIEGMLALEPQRPDLQHIDHNAKYLLRLINDLLDLSRAEIGELRITPEMIEPGTFLTEVFRSVADQPAAGGGISWTLQLPRQLPMLRADPDRLRQILLNLLSNAQKFTPAGEITLGAEITTTWFHLWVQDTGMGISAEQQERICEPFVSLNDPNRKNNSVGLGLSITRSLVALHDGLLTVESDLGKGSLFHVYLPLPNLKAAIPMERVLTETQPSLFLISDKDEVSPEITRFCENQMLQVHRLRTLDDVEQILHEGNPTAIAWDFDQSTENDWQILQHLHTHPVLCEVPFLLFSHPTLEQHSANVANIFLKPIKPKMLLGLINEIYTQDNSGSILIVDDNADARRYLSEILAKQLPTHQTAMASSGVQALSIMEQETPRLVILDLLMPEMDGFDVVRWMRSNQRTIQVPVFILSGKVLTLDDIKRLESYRKITFQTKNVLADDELGLSLHRVLFDNHPLPTQTSAIAKRAVAYIHQNYAHPIARAEIARDIGVSENYLTQIFHQELGISLWEYINRYRVTQAKELLSQTDHSVSYIASLVGFDDPAYFSRVFRRYVGQSPRTYRVS
jgi:signal transduction histidine kinase/AraC-like DNA-binding protein